MTEFGAEFGPGLAVVYGGSGFVGSQVVRALARRGWRVRVAVRNPVTANALLPMGDVGQIQLVRCDARRAEDVAAAARGATLVVNLIGVLHAAPGRGFQQMHVDVARAIAEAAKAAGARRFVQMSALGADAHSPSAYGRTKAEGETAVRAVFKDAVIVRPSVIFGAADTFLNRFAALAAMAPALPLIGGGATRFRPVFVNDVAEAVARAAEAPAAAGLTYELGGPSVWTLEDILKLVLRETQRTRGLVPLPFFAARALGSMAQMTALFGLTPPLTADQVRMLETDNIPAEGAPGLADLGVEPTGLEAIAPAYLWRYRRGGQFAESAAG